MIITEKICHRSGSPAKVFSETRDTQSCNYIDSHLFCIHKKLVKNIDIRKRILWADFPNKNFLMEQEEKRCIYQQ